jgi:hypothetical protein
MHVTNKILISITALFGLLLFLFLLDSCFKQFGYNMPIDIYDRIHIKPGIYVTNQNLDNSSHPKTIQKVAHQLLLKKITEELNNQSLNK